MGLGVSCCEDATKREDTEIKGHIKNNRKKASTKGDLSKLIKENTIKEKNLPVEEIDEIIITRDILIHGIEGTPLGKYSFQKVLGQGSYGKVYLVNHKETKLLRAMKQILKEEYFDFKNIKNEIDILKKLDFPNIIKIYEFFQMGDHFYIITEYCPEGDLFQKIVDGYVFTEAHVCSIIYQLLLSVYYCHINRVVHRDLKPENILIEGKDINDYFRIKVIDFGTATIFKNTEMKKLIGSGIYIAPEVINRKYNEKCDLWSVGIIMYVIFTAQAPFKGKNEEDLFYEIQNKIPNFNKPSLRNVSIEAKDLILRLLDKNYQTRLTALDALNHPWFKHFIKKEEIANDRLSLFINNLKSYKNEYKLQQAAIAVIVHNIPTNDEIKELERAFRVIDENGDGHLNRDELINGFVRVFNKNLSEATNDVDRIFKIVDADKNGVLEYEEFIRACIDKKTLLNDVYLRLAFNFFDRDQSGEISLKEMKDVFCGGNYTVGLKVLEKVISEVDINKDGQVQFEEFKAMMDKFIK